MLNLLGEFRLKCILKSKTDVQSQKTNEAKSCIHNILFQILLDAFQSLASSSELKRMALTSGEFTVRLRHFNY